MSLDFKKLWEQFECLVSEAGGRDFLFPFYDGMEEAFRKAGFREKADGSQNTILVLRTDAMGDNILTTPVLRELRHNCYRSRITLVTSPAAFPLMELCPYVNEVKVFDLLKMKRDGVGALERIAAFCREQLWARHFDLCLCPCWGSKPTEERFLAYMSGARERWGYSDLVNNFYMPDPVEPEEEQYFLTHSICSPPGMIHEAERYLYLLEAMGMQIENRKPELWLGAEELLRAKRFLEPMGGKGCLVAMCVGAKDLNRKYPLEQWREAMLGILEFGGRFVVLGGAEEMEDGEFLRESLPPGAVLNLAGRTGMRESAAVISLSDLYLGNVTGMMHAAAALGKPVITIYREAVDKEQVCTGVLSEYRRFAPYMTDSIVLRPLHALDGCRDLLCYGGCNSSRAHCIRQVRPEMIVEAFRVLMERRGFPV